MSPVRGEWIAKWWLLKCNVTFQLSTHEVVEVRAKLLYQVELQRASLDQMWGFSVEAELWENADRQDELVCFVSRVEERSVAMNNGESFLYSLIPLA